MIYRAARDVIFCGKPQRDIPFALVYSANRVEKSKSADLLFYGGDGGNRNRVRKLIPATFSERSL